jgi:tetratricopeptide (TPR) repeat protein
MITHTLIFAVLAQVSAIYGEVRDSRTHAPIAFARVELLRSQTPVSRELTGSDGRFGFGLLSPAQYVASVDISGYEPISVDFDPETTVLPIIIEMNRKRVPRSDQQSVVSIKQLMPKGATKEFDRARKEVQQDNCAEAIGHFERGLRAFDRDASAYNELGNCYRKLNRLQQAEASFKRARELTNSVFVALNLAEVYTAQKHFEEAKTVLNEAIEKKPDSGDAFYGLALVYLEEGRVQDAEAAALQAEARPHQIADLHLVLGKLYFEKGNFVASIRQLESYLKETPNGTSSESVKQMLGRCSGAEGTCLLR